MPQVQPQKVKKKKKKKKNKKRRVPIVAQWKWTQVVSMSMWVGALASLSGLRIWLCYELWCRSDLAQARKFHMLHLWPLGKKKKKKKKKKNRNVCADSSINKWIFWYKSLIYILKNKYWCSCRGTAEKTLTRNHAGLIPGLVQWVRDLVLLRAVV